MGKVKQELADVFEEVSRHMRKAFSCSGVFLEPKEIPGNIYG